MKFIIVLWSSFVAIQPSFSNDQAPYQFTQTITPDHFVLPSSYRLFASNGVEHELTDVVATVSSFTKDEDGLYKFAFNKEYPIGLGQQQTSTSHDTVCGVKIAAFGVALEMVGHIPNLGGSVRPRKRITPLNDFIFDFGENLIPKEMELVLQTEGDNKLKAHLKISLPNGNEKDFTVKSFTKEMHLLDSQHASITTSLSTETAASAFNVYWGNSLNEMQQAREQSNQDEK